jgi:hypothetical protein
MYVCCADAVVGVCQVVFCDHGRYTWEPGANRHVNLAGLLTVFKEELAVLDKALEPAKTTAAYSNENGNGSKKGNGNGLLTAEADAAAAAAAAAAVPVGNSNGKAPGANGRSNGHRPAKDIVSPSANDSTVVAPSSTGTSAVHDGANGPASVNDKVAVGSEVSSQASAPAGKKYELTALHAYIPCYWGSSSSRAVLIPQYEGVPVPVPMVESPPAEEPAATAAAPPPPPVVVIRRVVRVVSAGAGGSAAASLAKRGQRAKSPKPAARGMKGAEAATTAPSLPPLPTDDAADWHDAVSGDRANLGRPMDARFLPNCSCKLFSKQLPSHRVLST